MDFIFTVQKHAAQRNWESEGKMPAFKKKKIKINNADFEGGVEGSYLMDPLD